MLTAIAAHLPRTRVQPRFMTPSHGTLTRDGCKFTLETEEWDENGIPLLTLEPLHGSEL